MRRAQVPEALRNGPFSLSDARRAGLSRRQLQGRSFRRIAPRTYTWVGALSRPDPSLHAARLRLPSEAVYGGWTAARLLGIWGEQERRVEVVQPKGSGISARVQMGVSRRALPAEDVVRVGRWVVTSIPRTLRDLCARLDLVESVALVDSALHAGGTDLPRLSAWVAAHPGTVGIVNLRAAVSHAEPLAESPMESRLRMLLVLAGLARPEAQVVVTDEDGVLAGRVDLYYADARLGIEYDGKQHRESLADDNRRQNRLLAAGIRLLRFTAADIRGNPDRVVAAVRTQLELRRAG